MTVFSALNAVLVKKSPVQGVSQTLGLLVLVVKKSQVAETLVSSQEKQSVNNETWAKAKQVDFLLKYSSKSPWVSSSNKTFHKANSLLSRACPHTKWASSHLKAFRRNKACLPTKWVNSHLKAFRRNKACLPTKWVNSHPKTSNRPTSWVVLDLICLSNFVAPHFPAVLFLRKIQQM
jgi:hypothetical protein